MYYLLNNKNNKNGNYPFLIKMNHFNFHIEIKSMKTNKNSTKIYEEKEDLFNKIIKSQSYKQIVIKYNLTKYNEKIYKYYENILMFLFDKNKSNYFKVNIIGIIENINNISFLKLKNIINKKSQKIIDSIFYIEFLFNNSDNIESAKNYVLKEFINVMSIIFNRFNKFTDKSIKLYKKFLNCKYISNEDKDELKFFYNSLVN